MAEYRVKYDYTEDNSQKSLHGQNAQMILDSMVRYMRELKYIKEIDTLKEWSRPGRKGYRLYAPIVVTLFNDERWALYSTTS